MREDRNDEASGWVVGGVGKSVSVELGKRDAVAKRFGQWEQGSL